MTDARSMRAAADLLSPEAPTLGRFEHSADGWTWSDTMFEILGFEPGDIVPSTPLLLSHAHPGDRHALAETLRSALRDPGPFCQCALVVDADGRDRTVVVAGQSDPDERGRVVRTSGYVVDITAARRAFSEVDVAAALDHVVASRWSIEQAKGVLMAACGVDADTAFELLVQTSQEHNVKVRELAGLLLASLGTGAGERAVTRARATLRALAQTTGT